VSTTSTDLLAVARLPEESTALYVTVYVPRTDVSTDDSLVTATAPSTASVAVAPRSI